MAQDLGLHRESTQSAQSALNLTNIEMRRRVWATCVILDRWYAAALGVPLLIDLLDCDVLLPAPYEIIPEAEPSCWPLEPSYIALAEHLKLSILIGRVIKTIYSPTGLKFTTDEQLETLVEDIQSWKDDLPASLRFLGSNSPMGAGEHCSSELCSWPQGFCICLSRHCNSSFGASSCVSSIRAHRISPFVSGSITGTTYLSGHGSQSSGSHPTTRRLIPSSYTPTPRRAVHWYSITRGPGDGIPRHLNFLSSSKKRLRSGRPRSSRVSDLCLAEADHKIK